MTRTELTVRVGPDGVLSLNVPLGPADADHEVKVVVQPVGSSEGITGSGPPSWRQFVDETAGQWQGEPLARPDQGVSETRDELG